MALHKKNNLSEISKKIKCLSEREINWLWHERNNINISDAYRIITGAPKNSIDCVNLALSRKRDLLDRFYNRRSLNIDIILEKMHDQMLSKNDLAIIDNKNLRLTLWIHLGLTRHYDTQNQIHDKELWINVTRHVSFKSIYDEIVYAMDTLYISKQEKLDELTWYINKFKESSTPNTLLKWLNKKDPQLIDWTWNYICAKDFNAPINPPTNNEERYIAIFVSLDIMNVHPYEREKFIKKMRSAWSQKKYRESTDAKKPMSFSLSKSIRDKLDFLAKANGKKPTEIVAQLIENEYEIKKNK